MTTYGIIGDGRVATHFAHYFDLIETPYLQWSRKTSSLKNLNKLTSCDIILVLIKDDAIDSFLTEHPLLKKKRCVHFSGSLSSKNALGAHPLMTFGTDLYDLRTYERIPFILERGSLSFSELFPNLNNPSYYIDPEQKALYHALCVFGNFTTLLWQKLFKDFETNFEIPRNAAIPYLEKVCENLSKQPFSALTGPLAREDLTVIQKNIQSLSQDPYQGVYQSFVKAYSSKLYKDITQ